MKRPYQSLGYLLAGFTSFHLGMFPFLLVSVERGKPCEQVTQTLVGALHDGNELIMGANILVVFGDRWLPPILASWAGWRTERGL